MKKFMTMAAVAAGMAVSGLASSSASASSFNFVRNDCNDKTRDCFTFTNCETTVKATSDPRCSDVNWSNDGLGVLTGRRDNKEIESNEILWLTFCDPISLKSITFGNVGNCESYKLTYYSDNNCKEILTGQIPGGNWCDTGIGTVNFDCLGPVSKIGLSGLGCNDEFTVRSLETCEPCQPCAVPLPAAAWSGMGMLGLLGAGALRKKARKLLSA